MNLELLLLPKEFDLKSLQLHKNLNMKEFKNLIYHTLVFRTKGCYTEINSYFDPLKNSVAFNLHEELKD